MNFIKEISLPTNIFYFYENNTKVGNTAKVKATYDNDPDACVKCSGKVYENEKVMARAGCFHNSCLSCFNCNRTLDISRYIDGRDGGIYCKNCYSEKYGYRGRSQSRGKDVLFPAQSGDVKCPGITY